MTHDEPYTFHCHEFLRNSPANKTRNKLIAACVICLIFTAIEIIGGYIAQSLAILTDGAHMLTDFGSFAISLLSLYMSMKPPTKKMNFGWYRAEVLGALLSVLLIWALTVVLVYFAVCRIISNDYHIDSKIMLGTAAFGVVVNILMGMILHPHASHDHKGIFGFSRAGHHHHSHHQSSPNRRLANAPTKLNIHSPPQRNSPTQACSSDLLIERANVVLPDHDPNYNTRERDVNDGIETLVKTKLTYPKKQSLDDSIDEKDFSSNMTTPLLRPYYGNTSHTSVSTNNNPSSSTTQTVLVVPTIKRSKAISLALRAAYIHVLGDLIQSIGVLAAAFVVFYRPDWKIADPICTFVFSFFVILTTFSVLRDIIYVLLESTPKDIDFEGVSKTLLSIPGVLGVHDLKIWSLTGEKRVAIFHLVLGLPLSHMSDIQKTANLLLYDIHGIEAINIQIEAFVKEMEGCQKCLTGL